MEAELRKARQHLTATGHIARALAKRREVDLGQGQGQAQAQSAGRARGDLDERGGKRRDKAGKGGKAKHKESRREDPLRCAFFTNTGACALGDQCK